MTAVQRWAVVGTGLISRMILPDFRACDGVEIAVVHSRTAENARAFAAEFEIPSATDDLDSILNDPTVDAVYVATPYATHHDIGSRVIRAGKHLLVEKPMAMDAAQVEEMFELGRRHDVFVMEGMWMKFNPAFRRLIDELRSGRIGEPRAVRASFGMPSPDREGSRWDPERSPGALLDQGIYPVTLAHAIFGNPGAVASDGVVGANGVDASERFTLDFGDGRYAFGASSMTEFTELTASVSGTTGWIALPTPFWATTDLEIHADDFRNIMWSPEIVTLGKEGNGYVPMFREVVGAIAAGRREHEAHTADATLDVFRILDSIRAGLAAGNDRPKV